jgi:polyribonucleotide nucleotidyltransferase
MGMIAEGDNIKILTDILGDEDHLGDMDFKVAGTEKGITAVQMDIKIAGLKREIMEAALEQAKEGRLHILGEMNKAVSVHREELKPHSPRIKVLHINPDKIRDIIGPGGKVIKGIVEQTGVQIDVDDTGRVSIASSDQAMALQAQKIIESLTTEPEVGRCYLGIVKSIVAFGAFVEILPGQDGLCHISELAAERIENVEDVLQEGDECLVRVLAIDRGGKIKLSLKEAFDEDIADYQ